MATAKESETPAAAAEKNGSGGGPIVTLDRFRSIQREEKSIPLPDDAGSVRIRGLSVAQLDAINSELGEGISEFRMMAQIAYEGIVEPEGVEIDDLLGMPPSIVLLIGGEVASLSGMSESAVSAVEKSVREG